MNLVWTRDGKHATDTVHAAGCAHIRLAWDPNPLDSTDPQDALREIALSMGWEDYPEDADGAGFDLRLAPCVRTHTPKEPKP